MLPLLLLVAGLSSPQEPAPPSAAKPVPPVLTEATEEVDRELARKAVVQEYLRESNRLAADPATRKLARTARERFLARKDRELVEGAGKRLGVAPDTFRGLAQRGRAEGWIAWKAPTPEERRALIEKEIYDREAAAVWERMRYPFGRPATRSLEEASRADMEAALASGGPSRVPSGICKAPLPDGTTCPRKVAGGGRCYEHRD